MAGTLPLRKEAELRGHTGCVNCAHWHPGSCTWRSLLATGSDDCTIRIWDTCLSSGSLTLNASPGSAEKDNRLLATVETGHAHNIFGVKFLTAGEESLASARDLRLVSGAMDRAVAFHTVRPDGTTASSPLGAGHTGRVKEVCAMPDSPFTALSGAEDGTVRLWDNRSPRSELVLTSMPIKSIAVRPMPTSAGVSLLVGQRIAAPAIFDLRNTGGSGTGGGTGGGSSPERLGARPVWSLWPRVFDFTPKRSPSAKIHASRSATGVAWSRCGSYALVNYSGGGVEMFDIAGAESSSLAGGAGKTGAVPETPIARSHRLSSPPSARAFRKRRRGGAALSVERRLLRQSAWARRRGRGAIDAIGFLRGPHAFGSLVREGPRHSPDVREITALTVSIGADDTAPLGTLASAILDRWEHGVSPEEASATIAWATDLMESLDLSLEASCGGQRDHRSEENFFPLLRVERVHAVAMSAARVLRSLARVARGGYGDAAFALLDVHDAVRCCAAVRLSPRDCNNDAKEISATGHTRAGCVCDHCCPVPAAPPAAAGKGKERDPGPHKKKDGGETTASARPGEWFFDPATGVDTVSIGHAHQQEHQRDTPPNRPVFTTRVAEARQAALEKLGFQGRVLQVAGLSARDHFDTRSITDDMAGCPGSPESPHGGDGRGGQADGDPPMGDIAGIGGAGSAALALLVRLMRNDPPRLFVDRGANNDADADADADGDEEDVNDEEDQDEMEDDGGGSEVDRDDPTDGETGDRNDDAGRETSQGDSPGDSGQRQADAAMNIVVTNADDESSSSTSSSSSSSSSSSEAPNAENDRQLHMFFESDFDDDSDGDDDDAAWDIDFGSDNGGEMDPDGSWGQGGPHLLSHRSADLHRGSRLILSVRCFTGHRNHDTDIKECAFLGGDPSIVLAGSDCGSLFAWDAPTACLIGTAPADEDIVNVVQPHPCEPVVATSGISSLVRVWAPGRETVAFSAEGADARFAENVRLQGNDAMLHATFAQLAALLG